MTKEPIRCGVYTRKSTEDGLEQEFNSLDAQREACAAYITSQRHEGWSQVATTYDDGGYSGGTMSRPGLVQLLDDVRAGKVIEIDVADGTDKKRIEDMCEKLLANTVIEDYRVELVT